MQDNPSAVPSNTNLLSFTSASRTTSIRDRMRRLDEIRPQTDFDLYDAYVQAQSLSLPRRQPLLLRSAPESDSESDAPNVYYRTPRRPVRRLAFTSRLNANREERDSDSDTRTNVRRRRRNQLRPRAITSSATMNSVNDSNNSSQGSMERQPCNAPSWYQGSNIAWADENGFATDGDGNVM